MTVEEKIFPQDEPVTRPDEPETLSDQPETRPDKPEVGPDGPETPDLTSGRLAGPQTHSWRSFVAGMGVAVLVVALGAVLGYLARPVLEQAAFVAAVPTTPAEAVISVARTPVAATPPIPPVNGGEPGGVAPNLIADIVQTGGHSKGAADAPVVIVEYSDFQCPFCTRHWREVAPRLEEAYIKSGQVRFVYKHFTVKGPDSVSAALAAECAAASGQDKFWAYHDLLFSRSGQVAFNADNLKAFAAELQLDTAAFNECFDTQKYLQVVQANNAEAQQMGVGGTPGFFINGTPVAGAQPFEVFQQAIEAELAGVKSKGDTVASQAGPTSAQEDVAPLPANSASAAAPPPPVKEVWEVEIAQMRGLGFSADGRQLLVAANDGFRIFADGAWSTPDLPRHDYLGYSVTDDGFYSSGYPDPATNLVSPFGLVKSTDGGQTLTSLAFEGESDFNIIDVGYQNHAIYVFTSIPNSRLTLGIHYSLDDGQTWQESALRGIKSRMAQLAVHPTEANRVALATEGGLFLSSDYGDTFELIDETGPAIAAEFDPSGALLFFGYSDLSAYDLANKTVLDLPTPALSPEDAIARIAISPAKIDEMAFATFLGDLYLSRDGGQTWQQLLTGGKGKSGP